MDFTAYKILYVFLEFFNNLEFFILSFLSKISFVIGFLQNFFLKKFRSGNPHAGRFSTASVPQSRPGLPPATTMEARKKGKPSYFAQLSERHLVTKNYLDRSKTFQRYGLYAMALLIALLVGAATYARVRSDAIRSNKRERKRLKGEWCDDGEVHLKRCTTLDLTLRAEPLGDDGVKTLAKRLHGKQFARRRKGGLRSLILQHHGISSEGARRLAQLVAACADPRHDSLCAFDTSKRFELDLRANPLGKRGVEQLRAAVERAKSYGFRVVVWVGGHSEVKAAGGPRIKLGAIEVQLGKTSSQTAVEDREYRVPPTLLDTLLPHDAATTLKIRLLIAVVAFCCGLAAQHLQAWDPPVRLVWNEDSTSVRSIKRALEYLGLRFIEAIDEAPPPDAKAALRVCFSDVAGDD